MNKRSLLFAVAAVLLSACAGGAPKKAALSPEQAATLSVVDATVDVSAMGPNTEGRAVSAATVKRELESKAYLLKHRGGPRATRAIVRIENVNVINAAQSLLIGGESVMRGTVSLVDARTGAVIVPPVKLSSGGGGYVAGGIFGAASMEDRGTEVRQMATKFMQRARLALTGPAPQ
ncbi:hypothetical protein [Halovulum sp. GXIMD14793]